MKTKAKEADDKKKDAAPNKGEGGEKDPSKLAAESEGEQVPAKKDGEHSDEEQDKALIKKMIGEYLGQEEMENEEMMAMGKEVMEAYSEMGYGADEALKAAGHSMRLAKHMAGKQAKEAGEAEENKEGEEKKECAPDMKKDSDEKKESEAKESEENKEAASKEAASVLELKAEIAALKENLKKINVEKHLETVLKESSLPRSVTQVFKTHLGEPKSTKEIDEKFKLFVETYKATKGSETDGVSFVFSTEKTGEKRKQISFADCLK